MVWCGVKLYADWTVVVVKDEETVLQDRDDDDGTDIEKSSTLGLWPSFKRSSILPTIKIDHPWSYSRDILDRKSVV